MARRVRAALSCMLALAAAAAGAADGVAASAQVRLRGDALQANPQGPAAMANALQPATVAQTERVRTLEAELGASGKGWLAHATAQHQVSRAQAGDRDTTRAWFDELAFTYDFSHDAGAWQFTAGKRVVAWDVGYAFRPNDVVQQEQRRTLVSSTLEGRPLVMAEHFGAETAWSLVWVNPTHDPGERGAQEPALAARAYLRQGSADWHAFARLGARTGASLGAALAWVASDAVELHASARALRRADVLAFDAAAPALATADPWREATREHAAQALLGGTWTHESRFSVLAEAWWDGLALSAHDWRQWRGRSASLHALAARGAPAAAVAGNLAWQAGAFGAAPSVHRGNVYLRLAWEHEGWQPTLDVLVTPQDQGRIVTAALLWKGEALQVQGGVRAYGGPADAVLAQLPTRRHAYLTATWSF